MDTKILGEIGFTNSEIKVYLCLLEYGQSSAGNILKSSDLNNSILHLSLNSLIKKGFVGYIKKGKNRIYKASNPDSLLGYLEDKKDEINKILPELKRKERKNEEKEYIEMFEGIKGVSTALNTLIEDANKGDEFLFFSSNIQDKDKEIQKFYERYDGKRSNKRLITRGIAPIRLKEIFDKRKVKNMKYTNFPIPENQGICNGKMIIFSWEEIPKAILISSKSIVNKQRDFFNEFWKNIT